MDDSLIQKKLNALLAEVLTIQQWIGRYDLKAGRVAGIKNGVASHVSEMLFEPITEEDQEALDDILYDIERDELSPGKQEVRRRLRQSGVSESKLLRYLDVCKHDRYFTDAIEAIANDDYSHDDSVEPTYPAKPPFLGGMIYFELIDMTDHTRPLACIGPVVPRVGELIEPIKGDAQRVLEVRHVINTDEESPNYKTMTPCVYYAPLGANDKG